MKYFNITVNGKLFRVSAEEVPAFSADTAPAAAAAPAPAAPVPAASAPAAAVVPAAPAPAARTAAPPAGANADGLMTAPMPGTIISLSCSVGQTIKAGESVVILEAMKMENEIFASKSGTVSQIYVSKGDAVNAGDNLLLIE